MKIKFGLTNGLKIILKTKNNKLFLSPVPQPPNNISIYVFYLLSQHSNGVLTIVQVTTTSSAFRANFPPFTIGYNFHDWSHCKALTCGIYSMPAEGKKVFEGH